MRKCKAQKFQIALVPTNIFAFTTVGRERALRVFDNEAVPLCRRWLDIYRDGKFQRLHARPDLSVPEVAVFTYICASTFTLTVLLVPRDGHNTRSCIIELDAAGRYALGFETLRREVLPHLVEVEPEEDARVAA